MITKNTLPTYGKAADRKCGSNEERNCQCQQGASYKLGCHSSKFTGTCKFATGSGSGFDFLDSTPDTLKVCLNNCPKMLVFEHFLMILSFLPLLFQNFSVLSEQF